MNKEQIIEVLRCFINQRSGIDGRNYGSSREAFLGDYRPILRHGRHARVMLKEVARCSITAADLIAASRAYSGRLQFVEIDGTVRCDYTTGQYFSTEYRSAACAVLAQALWDHWSVECRDGHAIQAKARCELGRGIAATWFR